MFIIEIVLSFLAIALPVLISVAYLTLAERKVMGGMQNNSQYCWFLGLLHNGWRFKIINKELYSDKLILSFIFAILTFFLSLLVGLSYLLLLLVILQI